MFCKILPACLMGLVLLALVGVLVALGAGLGTAAWLILAAAWALSLGIVAVVLRRQASLRSIAAILAIVDGVGSVAVVTLRVAFPSGIGQFDAEPPSFGSLSYPPPFSTEIREALQSTQMLVSIAFLGFALFALAYILLHPPGGGGHAR